MKNYDTNIMIKIDKETKRKAVYVLGIKGKDLSKAIREMLDKYAKEFDEMQKK